MTKEESNYGKFHAIAILMIVLIFLLKLSSSSTPMKPNHEELNTQHNSMLTSTNSNLEEDN